MGEIFLRALWLDEQLRKPILGVGAANLFQVHPSVVTARQWDQFASPLRFSNGCCSSCRVRHRSLKSNSSFSGLQLPAIHGRGVKCLGLAAEKRRADTSVLSRMTRLIFQSLIREKLISRLVMNSSSAALPSSVTLRALSSAKIISKGVATLSDEPPSEGSWAAPRKRFAVR